MPFYPVGLLNLLNYGLQPQGKAASTRTKNKLTLKLPSDPHAVSAVGMPTPLKQHVEELVALYLSLELLWLAEGLHKHAKMIHGDIKPDNFRINDKFPLLDFSELDEPEALEHTEDGGGAVGVSHFLVNDLEKL